jgi:hypothetical protein
MELLLLVLALLALGALFGFGWLARLRTARRLLDVLDAYAQREIARSARWKIRNKVGRA